MKILIVDDSEPVRRTIRSFVSDLAEDLREAANGDEAIVACRERRPDWVLMDIQMGDMNGITATRHVKAAFPETRIMIVTSFDDAHLREAATQAGAIAYVTKDDLLEVRRILMESLP
ncbi:MAG: DNA-binding response regulator [Acidobacteria bacterium]|nr:MAG: DNA-binding response regulator [Acidobacteriota bacterium]